MSPGRRRQQGASGPLGAEELDGRIAGLQRAVHAAGGRLADEPVRVAQQVLQRARERQALAGDLTVVALAGSTGAGKSSLFNAILGRDVARVAATRPTTDQPLAALWTSPAAAGGLLDWLEVRRWELAGSAAPDLGVGESSSPDLSGLVLLDLPDHDSTVAAHRAQVDRLVERVDVMVWVLDPQKYADALVHDAYLARFARHAEVTLVLLNQVDRLADSDAEACLAHLRTLVDADGLAAARVLAVSATTGRGLPEVREVLASVASARRAALQRTAADLATAAEGLAASAGDPGGALPRASGPQSDRLADALCEAAGVRVVQDAVRSSVRRSGARATGWPPVRWIHVLRPDPAARLRLSRPGVEPGMVRTSLPSASPVSMARVAAAAREYADAASAGAPAAWIRSTRAVAMSAVGSLGPYLDSAVARADVGSPKAPRWWGLVGALQWLVLVVAAAGGVWLLGLVGLRLLALPAPDPPQVGALPVPTVLLVAGCLVGVVMAGLAGLLTRSSARRAAGRARRAVRGTVAEVARERVEEPVAAELATLAEFRIGLVGAQGG